MQTDLEAGRGSLQPQTHAQARRSFPALLLDRDALERFLARAVELVPRGAVTTKLTVRDGEATRSFPTLRDLAADPDLSTRLRALELDVSRSERGVRTHELLLRDGDGHTTLLAIGEELWAYGALGILASLLEIYGKRLAPAPLAPVSPVNFFSAGFTLALAIGVGHFRGLSAAIATALSCGAAWFLLDMALSELRVALTGRAPLSLTIEIRSGRRTGARTTAVRVWVAARALALVVWLAMAYGVFAFVVPHVPKVW